MTSSSTFDRCYELLKQYSSCRCCCRPLDYVKTFSCVISIFCLVLQLDNNLWQVHAASVFEIKVNRLRTSLGRISFLPSCPVYILITNLMHWLLFIHKIIFSSTCFEPQVLIFRRIQLYTCSIWYFHSLWEFLVACRYTAWVRTDCRGKVVGRAS